MTIRKRARRRKAAPPVPQQDPNATPAQVARALLRPQTRAADQQPAAT